MFFDQSALPAKQIVSKIIFTNKQGELLIAKATYKPGWVLIGGINEKDESPLAAALREIQEETGLMLDASRLRLAMLHYTPATATHAEHSIVVFAAILQDEEIAAIKLDPSELGACQFIQRSKLSRYAPSQCAEALVAMWAAGYQAGYGENSQFIGPITV